MTIRSAAVAVFGLVAMGLAAIPASGQTMVEAAGASSAASGSAGALKALGDTIKGALGGADNTIRPATTTTVVHTSTPTSTPTTRSRRSRTARSAGPVAPPAPKPVYEDPQKIQKGLAYDEMIRRFGPPSLTWTDGSASTMITYLSKAGAIQLECAGGKIVAVNKPEL